MVIFFAKFTFSKKLNCTTPLVLILITCSGAVCWRATQIVSRELQKAAEVQKVAVAENASASKIVCARAVISHQPAASPYIYYIICTSCGSRSYKMCGTLAESHVSATASPSLTCQRRRAERDNDAKCRFAWALTWGESQSADAKDPTTPPPQHRDRRRLSHERDVHTQLYAVTCTPTSPQVKHHGALLPFN